MFTWLLVAIFVVLAGHVLTCEDARFTGEISRTTARYTLYFCIAIALTLGKLLP